MPRPATACSGGPELRSAVLRWRGIIFRFCGGRAVGNFQADREPPCLGAAGVGCVRVDGLAMDLDAEFVDDDDRKGAVLDPGVVTEPPRKLLAMLDCIAGRRKFQSPSVSDWYAVLGIKVESSHYAPVAAFS